MAYNRDNVLYEKINLFYGFYRLIIKPVFVYF